MMMMTTPVFRTKPATQWLAAHAARRCHSTKAPRVPPVLAEKKTLYNPLRSAFNDRGYLRKKFTPGVYRDPPVSSVSGAIHSDTIPRCFMAADDPRRQLPRLDPWHNIESTQAPHNNTHAQKKKKKKKKYHLTPEDIDKMQELRGSGQCSVAQLAREYAVTTHFVNTVSTGPKKHRAKHPNEKLQRERGKRRQLQQRFV